MLLARSDDLSPVLAEGLEEEAVLEVPEAGQDPDRAKVPRFDRRDADPNDLPAQRWGVVAPEGKGGDALLEAIAPLRELREHEQGAPAMFFRVPPEQDAAAALTWRDKTYRSVPARERPRFLLLLGDLGELSIELQHVLAHSAFVGRLAFSDPAGQPDLDAYKAYARKAQAAEQGGITERPEVLLYTASDGTQATELGSRLLVTPCRRSLATDWKTRRFGLEGEEGQDPKVFRNAAGKARGAVLLSVTHGLGRAPGSGSSPEEQRFQQGALVLDSGTTLTANEVRSGPFLPGGIWFCVACFGAATPPRSAFYPWLELLARHGAYGADARAVLEHLPRPEHGERAFVAALPQTALANPEGPLAIIGHSDLAWTYAFSDLEDSASDRSTRISGVLESLARGSRAGVGLDLLMDHYRHENESLRADHQARQNALVFGQPDPVDPRSHGHRWMLSNDLRGYLLLGDPAARLRTKAAPSR